MPANLENSTVATGLEKSVFIPIPKKGNAKECSNYCTVALISHTSKVVLKSFNQASIVYKLRTSTCKTWFQKMQRNQRSNCQHPLDLIEKAREFHNTSTFASLTALKPLIVWIKTNWKILKEMRISDHFICLLRNLYSRQEATIKTRHEQETGSRLGKEYVKSVYCHPAYLAYMQSTP